MANATDSSIDREQINGAFALAVEVNFHDLSAGAGQKVLEFSGPEGASKIWFGQIGETNDVEFVIIQDGVEYRVVAEDAIVEGELATWRVGVDPEGVMRIAKGNDLLATAEGVVPSDIDRLSSLIGQSSDDSGSDLVGFVDDLRIANYGNYAELNGISDVSPCAVTGEASCVCDQLAPGGLWEKGDFGANSISTTDAEGDGEWSGVIALTIIPLHSIVLPDGKVLAFGSTEAGGQGGQFVYTLFDPETGVEKVLPNTTGVNTFCSNMSLDPATGNVIIMGGDGNGTGGKAISGVNDVVVFDYRTQTIKDADQGDMAFARWYPTTINLPNGEILVIGGRDDDFNGVTVPEVFNSETGWRQLTDADMPDFAIINNEDRLSESWWYPHTWVNSRGEVIVVEAHGDDIYRLSTDGTGSVEKIGSTGFSSYKLNTSIMFDVDKVAIIGDDGGIYTADISQEVPVFTKVATIEGARTNAGLVLMPDGRVAITGGGNEGYQGNDLDSAVYNVTIWDPETNETIQQADAALARLYHSSHLLLPDGTIWSAGGGAPGPLTNTNAELYAPSYLYGPDGELAERPFITDAPANIEAGQTFLITVDDTSDISQITAVKSGAMTHARNADGRFLSLDFHVVDGTTIEVSTPAENIMIGGVWMLFAVDAEGVPSEASMLGVDMAPVVETPPLEQTSLQYFNIDDDPIDGAFALTVEARFDDLDGGEWQRVFDFGNGPNSDNIWLGQVGNSDDMAFEIWRDGEAHRITAEDVITEGEVAEWKVDVSDTGFMRLWKDDVLVASGQGAVPADVDRVQNFIGDSNWTTDSRLIGQVRNLEIVNAGDVAENDGRYVVNTPDAPDAALVFEAEASARFDDLDGGRWQRIFDFGNGANSDNVWLGQVGDSDDMRFEVLIGSTKYAITAPDAIVEGEVAEWRATIDTDGVLRIYKDGDLVAEGQGQVPSDIDRADKLVGESNWAADTPLIGEVLSFTVNEDGALTPPVLSLSSSQDILEGNEGDFSSMVFNVSLDKLSAEDVTAEVSITGGSGPTQVTIPAGQASASIFVRIEGDNTFETDETVSVQLSNLQNADAGETISATARILNDDEEAPADTPEDAPDAGPDAPLVFEAEASARFDDLDGGQWQRIFDYGNGADSDNIWLGQVGGSDDMRFEVLIGSTKYAITAPDAIVEGEVAEWRATIDTDGVLKLFKDGDLVAEGQGQVPSDIDRTEKLVGESNWAADTPLIGEVLSISVNEDGPLSSPVNVITASDDGGWYQGTDGDDDFQGGDGNDTFHGGKGDDIYDGAGGAYNQVDFDGSRDEYQITRNDDGTVTFEHPTYGTDTLQNIDGVWFSGESKWYAMNDLAPQPISDEVNIIEAGDNGGFFDGTAGHDDFRGGAGDDVFHGGTGNDLYDGGGGNYNQVNLDGKREDYTFIENDDGSVTASHVDYGQDVLKDIDGIWFNGDAEWVATDDLIGTS